MGHTVVKSDMLTTNQQGPWQYCKIILFICSSIIDHYQLLPLILTALLHVDLINVAISRRVSLSGHHGITLHVFE